ncbi:SPOR domain-containing protein [Pseudovibrio sp. Tun.PSC04-5.I4]|uniref:SPOR domain-containing protein n=1 Tax=Pseudovibrio sp. Tun.PSC04-5.I4 TaxID=1798213 RepID=UPI000891F801|nr:SPOR domain-containing protein [Pseudovibrio sp. Tun.PSC04-5.I4]SDR04767.1 Sporulation related domain-containing protein [Pseudovibrio sp. Tun.PSC04-5.I4]
MTNRSNYPEPGEVSARQTAGDEPQQWVGDEDPLVELARIVGKSASAYRPSSRVESHLSEKPLFPKNDERSAGGEADRGYDGSRAAGAQPHAVGSIETTEPAEPQDSFAALDAVFASPKSSSHSDSYIDPFADLSAAALSVGGSNAAVDYVSDLPPVPKARPVQEPQSIPSAQHYAAPVQEPAPAVEFAADRVDPNYMNETVSAAEVALASEIDDVLSRDLEESLVASLNPTEIEREITARPARVVSRATPTLDAMDSGGARPELTLRERLGRRSADPQYASERVTPSYEPVAPTPEPVAPAPVSPEPKALNELSQMDYDSWRAERAAERATAAATATPAQPVSSELKLRRTHDDTAPAVQFEPDMSAFALETGLEGVAPVSRTVPVAPAPTPSIPSKHLEDALMAEFSLDEPAHEEVAAEPVAAYERLRAAEPINYAREIETGVDDIFADEIAREPQPEPEPDLEPDVKAELNEFEAMSAGFEQVAQEIDPFANENEDAWQLDEGVADDPSLDEMSWPAAAEKLAQTEAAHQAALNATHKGSEEQSPPPGGYDLDAVAQAMRQEDPSLDGGVLPQAVPRISVDMPHEDVRSGGGMRKGLMAAASIAAIVAVGGAGLFFIDFGGAGGNATAPPIIRADASAMKEVPAASDQPKNDQAKIFSPQEAAQPADGERMVQRENAAVESLPPAPRETDTATRGVFEVNKPKKVVTVTVRPDGTIVQRQGTGVAQPTNTQRIVTTSTVRTANPQQSAASGSGQWAPLPGENQSANQQAAAANQPTSLSDAFANASDPGAQAVASIARGALANVNVMPQSKPFVTASANTGVQSNTLAPLQPVRQAPRAANTPLDLTGGRSAQTAAVNPQAIAPTPTLGNGVEGEIPTGTYIVQVASVRTVEQAKGQISSYNRRYPNLMALVTPVITRADLGDKGVFYRIQVPFDGPTSANTFCGEFKSAGGDCYVRRN